MALHIPIPTHNLIIDLESDMTASPEFREAITDDYLARQIFTALVSNTWFKVRTISKDIDDQTIEVLSADYTDASRTWSCSTRYASEVMADMRKSANGTHDDYMDWYASHLAEVEPIVMQMFRDIGWILFPGK